MRERYIQATLPAPGLDLPFYLPLDIGRYGYDHMRESIMKFLDVYEEMIVGEHPNESAYADLAKLCGPRPDIYDNLATMKG